MSELERIIHDDSNDLDYILVGEIYLPLIAVPEEKRDIGFYGSLHRNYLKDYKMFLFENVRGLLSHDKGKTYQTITSIFEQAGYTIQKSVLNAWDYGVPQKRERLITVGIRNDLFEKIHFDLPEPHDYKPVLRDVLLDCPKSDGTLYSEYKTKIFEQVPPGGYWRDIDPEIAKEYM